MNILFVNYGQAGNNTTHHMAGFALAARCSGHDVAMAAPKGQGTWALIDGSTIPLTDLKSVSQIPSLFPNGHPPDLIHAFTPRESVRRFVFECFRFDNRAALAIHLEDNEEVLMERFSGLTPAEAEKGEPDAKEPEIVSAVSSRQRWRLFLALADRISVIYRTLGEFAPREVPWAELPPVLDMRFFAPRPIDYDLRKQLGVPEGVNLICYTGNDHYANLDDVRQLYQILHGLNQRGTPTWLLRTGETKPGHSEGLGFDPESFMTKLGYVPREDVPKIMGLCDVFVQPGGEDAFNRYRLPAKVPEYLALGKPVILGPANIAGELQHGQNVWLAGQGSVEDMILACRTLLADAELRERIGRGARQFAEQRFGLENAQPLIAKFYEDCAESAKNRTGARGLGGPIFTCVETEAAALAAFLREDILFEKAEALARKPDRNDKALKELEDIKASFAWRVARPIRSLTRRLKFIGRVP